MKKIISIVFCVFFAVQVFGQSGDDIRKPISGPFTPWTTDDKINATSLDFDTLPNGKIGIISSQYSIKNDSTGYRGEPIMWTRGQVLDVLVSRDIYYAVMQPPYNDILIVKQKQKGNPNAQITYSIYIKNHKNQYWERLQNPTTDEVWASSYYCYGDGHVQVTISTKTKKKNSSIWKTQTLSWNN